MTTLQLAFALVMGTVVVVGALVYWHESRRPEIRGRPDAEERADGPDEAGEEGRRRRRRPD